MSRRKRSSKKWSLYFSVLIILVILVFAGLTIQGALQTGRKKDGKGTQASSYKMTYVGNSSASEDQKDTSQDHSVQKSSSGKDSKDTEVQQISPDGLHSANAYMIRARDGAVLLDKGGEEQIYPASITKIMTCMLALEHFKNLDQKITIKQAYIDRYYKEGASRAGFKAGEQVSVQDLLYAIMLPSGADACLAVSDSVGGSEEQFVQMMNNKAKELGMEHTNFTNSVGMHDDHHYSTCRDFSVLMQYAIQNETFRKIVSARQYVTEKNEFHPDGILLKSTYYPYMATTDFQNGAKFLGGKTGYTSKAQQTFATYAEFKGENYILVTARGSGASHANIEDAVLLYSRLQ